MLEAIKIECWDDEEAQGSIEIQLVEADPDLDNAVVHIEVPMLVMGKEISFYLNDLKKAIRRLELE